MKFDLRESVEFARELARGYRGAANVLDFLDGSEIVSVGDLATKLVAKWDQSERTIYLVWAPTELSDPARFVVVDEAESASKSELRKLVHRRTARAAVDELEERASA